MHEDDELHPDMSEPECEQVIDLSRFYKLRGLHVTTAGASGTHCEVMAPTSLRLVSQDAPRISMPFRSGSRFSTVRGQVPWPTGALEAAWQA